MERNEKSFFSPQKLIRLFHTVRYLKWQQIYYRFYYPIKRTFYKGKNVRPHHIEHALKIEAQQFPLFSIDNGLYEPQQNTFNFLNKTKTFGHKIDWTINEYGLLWSFHIHYFDWLNDESIAPQKRIDTIHFYIDNHNFSVSYLHSYSTSIRIVNWVKFLIKHQVKDVKIIKSLYAQAYRLSCFPEYELMGNHLLENGIALVWAGYYFGEQRFSMLGTKIVEAELKEQILKDGAHFEKSTSYHSLILKNLLSLLSICLKFDSNLIFCKILKMNCSAMLSHLIVLTENSNESPAFSDSNIQISVLLSELKAVAQDLNIEIGELQLNESGFRKLVGKNYKLLFNNGIIVATYQPGHSHADAFSFTLNIDQKPIIVNRGISTYERSGLRLAQRGTSAHNTICVADENISDVWSAFRMGRRAEIETVIDNDKIIGFEHNGYFSKYKIIHQRVIKKHEFELEIDDYVKGWNGQVAKIYFHFHPSLVLKQISITNWKVAETDISISINGAKVYLENYEYCVGFNKTQSAQRLVGMINEGIVKTIIKTK